MGLSSTTTQSYHFFSQTILLLFFPNNIIITSQKFKTHFTHLFLDSKPAIHYQTPTELKYCTLFSLPHGLLKKLIKTFSFSLTSNRHGKLCRKWAWHKKKTKETSSTLHHVIVGNLDLWSVWFVFILSSFSTSVSSPILSFIEKGWSFPWNVVDSIPQHLIVVHRSTSWRRKQRWCL